MSWEELALNIALIITLLALLLLIAFAQEYPYLGYPLMAALVVLLFYLLRRRRERQKIRVATLRQLKALSPETFEHAVATLLEDLGFRNVRVTGGAGDLARDIHCVDDEGGKVVVQCKRYKDQSVNSDDMQKFIGMMVVEHKGQRGIYATTSSFTEPARSLAKRHNVELWDGNKLADLLVQQKERTQKTEGIVAAGKRPAPSKVQYCPKCGASNLLDWKYCGQCGARLAHPDPAESK